VRVLDQAQTLLAYEMNGGPLPIKHGAPLRLRLETQVGFKMAKWIERIEFVSDCSNIGEGMGDGARITSTTTRT
jgi:methionine sulfoxide reductase catalytic subunit